MHRIISIFFLCFLVFSYTFAQELMIRSFSEKSADLSASTKIRKDDKGASCALVKVLLAANGAQFTPDVIGTVENFVNEYWVYLPAGSSHLTITLPNFLSTDVVFENYGVLNLEPKTTYEMVIDLPNPNRSEDSKTALSLEFNVEPEDAVVVVNGEVWNTVNGVAHKVVPPGKYVYLIESKMYHPESGRVEVVDSESNTQVSVSLKPAYGFISVLGDATLTGATIYIDKEDVGKAPIKDLKIASGEHSINAVKPLYVSEEQTFAVEDGIYYVAYPELKANYSKVTLTAKHNAEIWVNGERKGLGSWTGNLVAGDYILETRLEHHRSTSVSRYIPARKDGLMIALESPVPIYGGVNISSTPERAEVYIDNQLVGRTPLSLPQYLVGEHKVRICKSQYWDYQASFTISEGNVTEVVGTLSDLIDVTLSSNVSTARLWVDGLDMGSPSKVSQIGYGRHDILLKAEGCKDYTETIEVIGPNQSFRFLMEADVEKRLFTVNGIAFSMIQVQGGTFNMGATSEQQKPDNDEKPVHQVTLLDYYIGETEVTQALWNAVMGTNPSAFKGDNLPVETISWKDCQTFISRLNALTGQKFRLPTEAEWEFAARGGNNSRGYQFSGSNNLSEVAWFSDNSLECTHDVKTKGPNELGIYDMSGNVWEWCQDWKESYGTKAVMNPTGATAGTDRVHRGGSWFNYAQYCRLAFRFYNTPECRSDFLGLRLAL
jgi:formylglycine-generating enzyme required for sulfatase activity